MDYTYIFGEGIDGVHIKYYPQTDKIEFISGIDSVVDQADSENLNKIWSSGAQTTDTEKYKMRKRFDISEKELGFIDENTTYIEVQRAFGAPHYIIEGWKPEKETSGNAFIYELENGNLFKIIYFREGFILWAWVEDKDGKEIELLAEGNKEIFYEDF